MRLNNKLNILSLKDFESLIAKNKLNKDYSVISISDSPCDYNNIDFSIELNELLRLSFYDYDNSTNIPDNFNLFTNNESKLVIDFFKRNRHNKIIIHCYAGVSRSSALGLSYAWFLENEELEQEIINNSKFIFNSKVLEIMAENLGILEIKKEIINKYKRY